MFVGEELRVPVSFDAAFSRLASLIRGGALVTAAHDTYGDGVAGLLRVGPRGVPLVWRLVEVQFGDLVVSDRTARVPLRWQAAGLTGALFPVLDADIALTAAGGSSVLMRVDGTYRPPMGRAGASLDQVVLHRVATATVRGFLERAAALIARPGEAAGTAQAEPGIAPGMPPVLDMP